MAEFAAAAARLAGMAGALLGWRPDEFWTATPAELAAVLRALGGEGDGAGPVDLERLMSMFPDDRAGGEPPPPACGWSPSPCRGG